MARFSMTSEMPVSPEELFAWHARPAAFFRLVPPWERVEVDATSGPFADGFQIRMKAKILGPITKTWTAELFDVKPGEQFRDRQLSGPFASWEHTHRMLPDGNGQSRLQDEIDYRLPFGLPGRVFGSSLVRSKLAAMFAYRHRLTANDLKRHRQFQHIPRKTIAVTGSSGLVGNPLCHFLASGGHQVVRLVRSPLPDNRPDDGTSFRVWNPYEPIDPKLFDGVHAVVHLAGEGIAEGRWTKAKKARIRESRIIPTRHLAEALAQCERQPEVLVSASAVGYYGTEGDTVRTDESPAGQGFLAEVAQAWEAATRPAADAGIRVAIPRISVVQTPAGGALGKQLMPFLLGTGAVLGSGEQWISWITVNDLVYALHHAILSPTLNGPFNCCTPTPVTNRVYGRLLARVLRRPYLFTLPGWFLRLAFGELADGALLASMRCEPNKLLADGFLFNDPELEPALRHLLGKNETAA